MPEQYEAMRDRFIREGMSEDEAQSKAARIYLAGKPKGKKRSRAAKRLRHKE